MTNVLFCIYFLINLIPSYSGEKNNQWRFRLCSLTIEMLCANWGD